MGRRTKLLKPHSWGDADICLLSASPSVSLYPGTVISPPISRSLFCLRIPAAAPALLVAVVPLLLLFFFLFSLLFPVVLFFSSAESLGPNLTT